MKIYTKTGDTGTTSLFGGKRVSKSSTRFEAIGSLDELNSYLGLVAALLSGDTDLNSSSDNLVEKIYKIQSTLLQIGADLATPYTANSSVQKKIVRLSADKVTKLEHEIDVYDAQLTKLTSFILPGGHPVAAHIQVARSLCRRAERNVIKLGKGVEVNPEIYKYLNRLSDWFFVAARLVNTLTKSQEQIWE